MSSIPVNFVNSLSCGVAVSTMGCKVNAFESELISEKLVGKGMHRVQEVENAGLFIINTCTVTAEADRQARQLVRRAIRSNPLAKVVVTGCYAEMDPAACSRIPGVDLVVGNSQKLDIPELVDALFRDKLPPVVMRDIDSQISLPKELLTGYHGKSRAFVQIQQGCDQGCTFCIIHVARGPNRSFSQELIHRQCQRLVMNGYGEIVLCGVDVGSYGADLQGDSTNLVDLMQALMDMEGEYRVRLSSIDPVHITDAFIAFMAENEKLCPQLHLSLQSANSLILKRMKRRASRELIFDRIDRLRSRVPNLVLSADILVGFPTETETQFEETLSAIDELEIAYPHVFSYSRREGTPAARIPSQVPVIEKKRRAKAAREMGRHVWRRVAEKQVGRSLRVLREESTGVLDADFTFTRADNYFPVKLKTGSNSDGDWQYVKISGIGENCLLA